MIRGTIKKPFQASLHPVTQPEVTDLDQEAPSGVLLGAQQNPHALDVDEFEEMDHDMLGFGKEPAVLKAEV